MVEQGWILPLQLSDGDEARKKLKNGVDKVIYTLYNRKSQFKNSVAGVVQW